MINVAYILTFANDKRYVGISSNPEKRIPNHAFSKQAVGHAWRKHGKPDIQIAFSGTEAESKMREIMLIKNLNTQAPFGYNLTQGGDGVCCPSLETRQKLSKAAKNQVHTAERNAKISTTMAGRPGTRKGMTNSAEHNNKIAEAHLGKKKRPFSKQARLNMSIAATRRHANDSQ